jgi:hypothetical protein
VPAGLTGEHTLEIELNGRWPAGAINLVESRWSLETIPVTGARGENDLAWTPIPGAARYAVYRDGRRVGETTETRFPMGEWGRYTEWQVLAVDSGGVESYLSAPGQRVHPWYVLQVKPPGPLEFHPGDSPRAGHVRMTQEANTLVEVPVEVKCGGTYLVEPRYANGSGPINTDAKAAIRTLRVDGRDVGVLVMPQRGTELWREWGYGTALKVRLTPGAHVLSLAFTPLDVNMHGRVNTALLDHLRLTLLDPDGAAPPERCR